MNPPTKLSGTAWFAIMISAIWAASAVVTCLTGNMQPMGGAVTVTILAGIGYVMLH